MTRAAIITTTINAMPNMSAWVDQMSEDDVMIVVGDRRTPHTEIRVMAERENARTGRDIRYVHPDDQSRWQSSDVIPWNCIQRRNIAILEALTYEPEFILTIDDDNYPVNDDELAHEGDWLTRVHKILTTPSRGEFTWTNTGYFNPGELCDPPVVHRGFPPAQRHINHVQHSGHDIHSGPRHIGVFAALWLGDPDVDAVERIANAPVVERVLWDNVTLLRGTIAPFNSQATAYRTALAPALMCLPGVGRMDDIWASYVAGEIMEHVGLWLQYGHPVVRQDRNEHDLVRDLELELIGYRYTDDLLDHLTLAPLPRTSRVDELVSALVRRLEKLPYVPALAINAYDAWLDDLAAIDRNHPEAQLFDAAVPDDNDED